MATSLQGPFLELSALPTAPVPRPPQPTRASWMVLLSPAWTKGTATPARVEAAATTPAVFSTSRRDRPVFSDEFTEASSRFVGGSPGGEGILYSYTEARRES